MKTLGCPRPLSGAFFYYRSFQPQAIRHNRQRHGRATKIQTTGLLRIAYLCHEIFCRTNILFSEWGNWEDGGLPSGPRDNKGESSGRRGRSVGTTCMRHRGVLEKAIRQIYGKNRSIWGTFFRKSCSKIWRNHGWRREMSILNSLKQTPWYTWSFMNFHDIFTRTGGWSR